MDCSRSLREITSLMYVEDLRNCPIRYCLIDGAWSGSNTGSNVGASLAERKHYRKEKPKQVEELQLRKKEWNGSIENLGKRGVTRTRDDLR
jgi:hypothetical protein